MHAYDLQPITLLTLPLPSQSFTNTPPDSSLAGRLRSMQRLAQSGRLRGLRCHMKQVTRITTHQHSEKDYEQGVVASSASLSSIAIAYYRALSVESPLTQSVHQ